MLHSAHLESSAIREAYARMPPAFRDTPQFIHEGLSSRLNVPVIVKVETVSPIRSFKGRGTWTAVQGLAQEGRISPDRPVVCVSAGNFGQGVAYAARAINLRAVVFCSTQANPGKVSRMRALGAEVFEIGDDFDEARLASEAWAAGHDGELLVDGQDPRIAAGAATMALEVTDGVAAGELPAPAAVYVPVGNGSLLIGIGSWLRDAAPSCRVVGVQAKLADGMTRSWRAGRPIDTPSAATYADGIATRISIPAAVSLMAGRVDEMRTVSEDDLRTAQAELTRELGITVEGAAAATLAGALAGPIPEEPIWLIITGSNV